MPHHLTKQSIFSRIQYTSKKKNTVYDHTISQSTLEQTLIPIQNHKKKYRAIQSDNAKHPQIRHCNHQPPNRTNNGVFIQFPPQPAETNITHHRNAGGVVAEPVPGEVVSKNEPFIGEDTIVLGRPPTPTCDPNAVLERCDE